MVRSKVLYHTFMREVPQGLNWGQYLSPVMKHKVWCCFNVYIVSIVMAMADCTITNFFILRHFYLYMLLSYLYDWTISVPWCQTVNTNMMMKIQRLFTVSVQGDESSTCSTVQKPPEVQEDEEHEDRDANTPEDCWSDSMYTHTHTQAHTHMHAHTHAHTHTHTHTFFSSLSWSCLHLIEVFNGWGWIDNESATSSPTWGSIQRRLNCYIIITESPEQH